MNTSVSRVSTDIDFGRRGKHAGYLRVPHSSNESAYGFIAVPLTVVKNRNGPTVLLTAGVHGDEYEGQVTLMKLARELESSDVNGRVIIIPALNLPAAEAGQRCSPVDGLNMNRAFPGRRNGPPTEMIAHYVSEVLLPMTDLQVDLHSGGKTLEYIPTIIMNQCEDKERFAHELALVRLSGMPIGSIERRGDHGGLFEMECEARGIANVNFELGGAGRVTRDYVAMAGFAVRNLLRHVGVLTGKPEKPKQATRLVDVNDPRCNVFVYDAGLFEPFVELGENVKAGQALGQVLFPAHATRAPVAVKSAIDGVVLVKRPPGRVQPGDNVFIIATDSELVS